MSRGCRHGGHVSRAEAATSHYEASRPRPAPLPPLRGPHHCEVCIVGGGLLGVSTACHLAARGVDALLIEATRLGAGASGRNGGQVIPGFSSSPRRLVAVAGDSEARAIWRWTCEATALTRSLAARVAPAAIHGDGVIAAAADEAQVAELRDDQAAIAGVLGDDALEWLDTAATRARLGGTSYVAALRDPRAFHLDPLALIDGLAVAAMTSGARIAEGSPARLLTSGPRWRIETPEATVSARHAVLVAQRATAGLWPARRGLTLPIWTSMLATAPLPEPIRATILPHRDAAYDLATALAYWRITPDHRLLLGAGASGRTPDPADLRARLRPFLRRLDPALDTIAIERVWSGVVDLTTDRLPRFAAPERGLWIAHGLGGHGVALAVGGGAAIAAAIAGDREAFDRLARLPQPPIPLAPLVERLAVPLALSWLRLVARRR